MYYVDGGPSGERTWALNIIDTIARLSSKICYRNDRCDNNYFYDERKMKVKLNYLKTEIL